MTPLICYSVYYSTDCIWHYIAYWMHIDLLMIAYWFTAESFRYVQVASEWFVKRYS